MPVERRVGPGIVHERSVGGTVPPAARIKLPVKLATAKGIIVGLGLSIIVWGVLALCAWWRFT